MHTKTASAAAQLIQQQLLDTNQLSLAHFSHALSLIGAHQVDYADIYCQRTTYESWQLEEGMVKSGSFQIEQGMGIRAVSGEKTAFAYADNLTAPAMIQAAEAVRAIGQSGQQQTVNLSNAAARPPLYSADNPINSLDAAAKIALLQRIETLGIGRAHV